jgi:hypothetical protein
MKNYLALFSLLLCLISIACSWSGSDQIGGAQATNVPHVVPAVQSTPTSPLTTTATGDAPPAVAPTHTPVSQNDPTGTVSNEVLFSPGATQTPSHTPTPTPMRTPTHTVTPQVASGLTLPDELFFTAGGGGEWACVGAYEELPELSRPTFMLEGLTLCLFDFPANEWITIDLYGPDRNYLSTLTFLAAPDYSHREYDYVLFSQEGNRVAVGWDMNGKVLMVLPLWSSATMPIGDWSAIAVSETKYGEGTLKVFPNGALPRVTVGRDVAYDPFYAYYGEGFWTGEAVVISGTGFNSRQSLNLGIYYAGERLDWGYDLVYSQTVNVDARGDFSVKLIVEADDPEGVYAIVLTTDNLMGDWVIIPPQRQFVISHPAQINCSGAAQTRLNVGFTARVAFTDGTASRIRDLPASANVLASVPEGTLMTITGGPECHNQLVWWQVWTHSFNQSTGWLAEGKPGDYWLEPIDCCYRMSFLR